MENKTKQGLSNEEWGKFSFLIGVANKEQLLKMQELIDNKIDLRLGRNRK